MANWKEVNGEIIAEVTIGDDLEIVDDLVIGGDFTIGATALTETDLAKIDGITNGTGAAGKALVLNASSQITTGLVGLVASDYLASTREILNANGTTSGSAGVLQTINNAVTGLTDNTATAIATVTVPNAAHAAVARLTFLGSLGAGGAIGANEATGVISYNLVIARTAGVDTVATLSAAYGSATSAVAGAATITVAGTLSTLTGTSAQTQTFTINITVTKGSGSSANHTGNVIIELLNANATGITVT